MQRNFVLAATALSGYFMLNEHKPKCCGIIGIISGKQSNIGDTLSEGVELLKNRGYDSAGIVTFSIENGRVNHQMIKHAEDQPDAINCISRLVNEVAKKVVKSHIGIGHTRWATCGEKIVRNAHPHFDNSGSIYIVHNGIITGHQTLKQKYLSDVEFNSDTDTEVIVQFLGKKKKEGMEMKEALKQFSTIMHSSNSMRPQWGVVVMDKSQPDKMWTSTYGSPILIGFNRDEIFVASEVIAFVKLADFYFVTENNEIFQLELSKIDDLKKEMEEKGRLKVIDKKEKTNAQKRPPLPFTYFYEYELRQQGEIPFIPEFDRVKAIDFGPYLTIVACGSSSYAAQAAKYFYSLLKTFKKIQILDPVEMLEDDICPHETVVLVSQSGETKDLLNILDHCQEIEGVKTVGIINVEGSTLARKVDFPIYIKVGREASVAATKSMFHQVLNMIMLATEVAEKKKSASMELIKEIRFQLYSMPEYAKKTIMGVEKDCEELASYLKQKKSIYLLALREGLAIAKEAALKIKELTYIHAEALGSCEMKHGPLALIDSEKKRETPVILFVFDNETYEQMINAVDQMKSRNAFVVIVTNCKSKIMEYYEEKKSKANESSELNSYSDCFFISVPYLKHCSHLLSLLPMQILVEKLCRIMKNRDPDAPRNLAKTVTV